MTALIISNHQALIDFGMLFLGIAVGILSKVRGGGFFTFLQISLLLYKMAKEFFDKHPEASHKLAESYKKLEEVYLTKLEKHDTESCHCLAAGSPPLSDDRQVS